MFNRLNATFQTEWPSRVVPVIPLILHAYTLKPEEKYAKAAKILFEDLMRKCCASNWTGLPSVCQPS